LSCLPKPDGHGPLGKQLSCTLWLNPGGHLPVIGSGLQLGESGLNAHLSVGAGVVGVCGGEPGQPIAIQLAGGPGLTGSVGVVVNGGGCITGEAGSLPVLP